MAKSSIRVHLFVKEYEIDGEISMPGIAEGIISHDGYLYVSIPMNSDWSDNSVVISINLYEIFMQMINFLILLWLVNKFMIRPLSQLLTERSNTIKADITGGIFFRATDNKSLKKVYEEIDKLERTEIEVTEYQHYTELYSWLTIPVAFAAIFFIFISRGIFHKLF